MNIEQANAIPLPEILEKMNAKPGKESDHDLMYYSPFRQEKTPSLHVSKSKNLWYDFGIRKGGTVIDLVSTYLKAQEEDCTLPDALRWIRNMADVQPVSVVPFPYIDKDDKSPALTVKKTGSLTARPLLEYMKSRGIPEMIAQRYLQEALVFNKNTGREFYAVALNNEDGGYELRNRSFKGSTSPKGISFIRDKKFFPDTVHVFESFIDFLTTLMYQRNNTLRGDIIILNSVACLGKSFPYILNYSYTTVCSWLDNDAAGNNAAEALKEIVEKGGLKFKPMNNTYLPHKDVNEWHMHKVGLPKL